MPKVKIKTNSGPVVFEVEVVRTKEERNKGLMYRQSLAYGSGMLFIFGEPRVQHFWMKNTLIPLDILFIDEQFKLVHIEKHADPCPAQDTSCPLYSSEYPALYVLEIAGDMAEARGINEGDTVILDF